MTGKRNEPSSDPTASLTGEGEVGVNASRRSFLRAAAVKALYVTPAVLTLSASHAVAGSGGDFDSTCIEAGSVTPCAADEDCCNPAHRCSVFGAKECS